jgi:hypothetical protein
MGCDLARPQRATAITLTWDVQGSAPAVFRIYRTTGACPTEAVLPQAQLRVAGFDSEERVGEPGYASNAIDGRTGTRWHSQWYQTVAPFPHWLSLGLGGWYQVTGLTYLPRQDGTETNGTIAGYAIAVSSDGSTWPAPVLSGTWAANRTEKQVRFNATPGRFVKLTATSEITGQPFTSAAEVRLVGTPFVVLPATPLGEVPGTTLTYTDTTAPTETVQCYVVTARTPAGQESLQSNAVQWPAAVGQPPATLSATPE